ncbi:MAG TPA: sugar ABC transporter permease [Cellulomonas sp.]
MAHPTGLTVGGAHGTAHRVATTRRGPARRWTAWLFAGPSLAIIVVFILVPIGQSFWFSLHDWKIGAAEQEWLGAANYQRLLSDSLFWNALRVTAVFAVASVLAQLVLGYAAASALQGEGLVSRVVRSVYFFPTVVALATIGLVWRFLLDPNIGLVAGITTAFGLPAVGWLQDTSLALPTVIFVSVWKNVGFTMIILLAGLKGVSAHLYEAARLDGASGWQLTRHVTLPSIRPTLLFTTMILTINSFQVFDLVYVMTSGGPLFSTDTLVNMMVREGFENFDLGYASAIAWVLLAIILVLSAVQLRVFRYDDVD